MKQHRDLLYIDDMFKEIKLNRRGDTSKYIKSIERVLKRRYGLNVDLTIVENSNQFFFGMSVYPKREMLDYVVQRLTEPETKVSEIEEIWSKNTHWVIEIDSMILDDVNLSANPKELTAMLLHEIGHTVYANTIPQRIYKVYRYNLMTSSMRVKKIVNWNLGHVMFTLPIIQAIGQKSYKLHNRFEEKQADKFVVREGYGEETYSIMGKIISRYGQLDLTMTEKDAERELDILMAWSIDALEQLTLRRRTVESMLTKQAKTTNSPYVVSAINKILGDLYHFDNMPDMNRLPKKAMDLIKEDRSIRMYEEQVNKPITVLESFKSWFDGKKVKPIHPSDIDVINIEIDKIESESDRIFVLDMIYHRLDNINYQLELLEDANNAHKVTTTKSRLEEYKKDLDRMRRTVLSIKIPPTQYGVLVKYPKTYEG